MRDWRSWAGPGVAFGCDYNPEQWPRETWHEDVALMREAGVTFVSLGIFSWSHLQPSPESFEFGWLDEVMDLLHENGIAVDLATGTATPPPWFSHRFPQTLPQRADGTRLWPGSRQAWCPSSLVFTEHAVALVEQVAQRYREHPALTMWHVSNEYGCHNVPCFCDTCATGFRSWLSSHYADLDALNDAWGTSFWSQRYTDLEEVLPPREAPAFHNPTQTLDYRRYQSDALLAQHTAEVEVLRRVTPEVPVTTNFMAHDHFRELDYPAWVPHVDVLSTDHYVTARDDPEAELAFAADLTRGLAGGEPWLLMEHSTSAVNWQHVNRAKTPGQLMRHSLSHVARGADALGFFQWRASRSGAEKFHSALVPHAGTDTRLWREVVALGALAGRLGEVRGSRVEAAVALLWDYQCGWACEQSAHPSSEVTYGPVAHDLHAALRRRGVSVDVVPPATDLTGYRLVLVPTLYLCDDTTVRRIEAAAAAGAHVLVTYFSGIVDEQDHVRLGGYPGAFRHLLGVRSEELAPMPDGECASLDGDVPEGATGSAWAEDLTCTDAEAVATFRDGPVPGRPAVTRRETGAGLAWYVATRPDRATLDDLIGRVVREAGVEPVTPPAATALDGVLDGVEVVRRSGEGGSWVFAINHTADAVHLEVHGHDVVSQAEVGPLVLEPGACAVVQESSGASGR